MTNKSSSGSNLRRFNDLPLLKFDIEDVFLGLNPSIRSGKIRLTDLDDPSALPTMEEFLLHMAEPRDIREFATFARELPGGLWVVRTELADGSLGQCFLTDDISELVDYGIQCIIALRPTSNSAPISTQDLFLHEVVHWFSDGSGEMHDWRFLCSLNAMRHAFGLAPSQDPYDFRDGFAFFEFSERIPNVEAVGLDWCAKIGALVAPDRFTSRSWQEMNGLMLKIESMLRERESTVFSADALDQVANEVAQWTEERDTTTSSFDPFA